jgi:hypothetical protein
LWVTASAVTKGDTITPALAADDFRLPIFQSNNTAAKAGLNQTAYVTAEAVTHKEFSDWQKWH